MVKREGEVGIATVTMLAACLLLLVLLYVPGGQSGFSDEAMMMHSGGGSKPVAMVMSIPGVAAVTMLAACLLLLVLLYVAGGQSGFSDEAMMMHSSGGSKPVAMAIQGEVVRGLGPLNKELVSNNIRSKHGRNKKKQNRLAIVLAFAVVVVLNCGRVCVCFRL
jgi:hypothetical protein